MCRRHGGELLGSKLKKDLEDRNVIRIKCVFVMYNVLLFCDFVQRTIVLTVSHRIVMWRTCIVVLRNGHYWDILLWPSCGCIVQIWCGSTEKQVVDVWMCRGGVNVMSFKWWIIIITGNSANEIKVKCVWHLCTSSCIVEPSVVWWQEWQIHLHM